MWETLTWSGGRWWAMDDTVRAVIAAAVERLDREHPGPVGDDETYMVCCTCYLSWPCASRLVADDLRALLAKEDG